jgi:hypothetical protein
MFLLSVELRRRNYALADHGDENLTTPLLAAAINSATTAD